MKFISHRGYWKTIEEKNSFTAFKRSFDKSFGIETDIRDYKKNLVIAHEPATGEENTFTELLDLLSSYQLSRPLVLALNIKADGLADYIKEHMLNYPKLDYFVFDMSIPDMLSYFKNDMPVFTRMSEVERNPAWLDKAKGVWLGSFTSEWFDMNTIKTLLAEGKHVCIVSPELHRREYLTFWAQIKCFANEENIMLCTDYPEKAMEYFKSGCTL